MHVYQIHVKMEENVPEVLSHTHVIVDYFTMELIVS